MSWINQGSERGQCLGFNTCLLCAQSSGLALGCLVQNGHRLFLASLSLALCRTHMSTHAHLIFLYSPSQRLVISISQSLHFALYLAHSISSSNINSHLCCRPVVHTRTQAHTDFLPDLSLSHSLNVFVQILAVTQFEMKCWCGCRRSLVFTELYTPDFSHSKLW